VESPSKTKKVQQYAQKILNDTVIVRASLGHFTVIKDIDYQTFKISYQLDKVKAKNIKQIIDIAKKGPKMIYIATDPDREGEAIGWHLYTQLVKNKIPQNKIKRVCFNEITEYGIKEGLKNATDINMDIVKEQETRLLTDRFIGFTLSPLVMNYFKNKNHSVGRVQTPALKLLKEKQDKIENFKPEKYFEIILSLEKNNIKFEAKQAFKPKDFTTPQTIYDKYNRLKKIKVINVETKIKKQSAPAVFSTQTLQGEIAKVFNIKPDGSAKILQSLYEKGFITYHRTDSTRVSDEGMRLALEIMKSMKLDHLYQKNPGKSGEQDAHEGIRVTHANEDISELNDIEKKIYNLILKRFVASQMKPMVYEETKVTFEDNFISTGITVKEKGFTEFDSSSLKKDTVLPKLNNGEVLDIKKIEKLEKLTKAPAKETITSLLAELKRLGIGRPSTYPTITKKLETRKYIAYDNKNICVTDLGKQVVNFVYKLPVSNYVDIDYTAKMEETLDKIANRKISENERINLLRTINTELNKELNKYKTNVPKPYNNTQVSSISNKKSTYSKPKYYH
jgi:DNA topoisomerase-1